MKYAVIQTGGKQYKVTEGSEYTVERLPQDVNGSITFSDVLLFIDGETVQIGSPYVDGVAVNAVIVSHPRGDKIRVAKFKAKARFRRTMGHRQELSTIKVESIGGAQKVSRVSKVSEVPQATNEVASTQEVKAAPKKIATKKTVAKKV